MPQINYTEAALKALLQIFKGSTPTEQPSDGVLKTYLALLDRHSTPQLESIKKEVEALRRGQAMSPAVNPALNRLRRQKIQSKGNTRAG